MCTLTCHCCVPLHVQDMCLCKQTSVYCKQDSVKSSVCPSLHSCDPSSAPRPPCWSCLTTLSSMWSPTGTTLVLSFKDHLLEDIKVTKMGEVETGCSDMLKCRLRGEWPWEGGVELVHRVGGSAEVPQRGVSLEQCCSLQAAQ